MNAYYQIASNFQLAQVYLPTTLQIPPTKETKGKISFLHPKTFKDGELFTVFSTSYKEVV